MNTIEFFAFLNASCLFPFLSFSYPYHCLAQILLITHFCVREKEKRQIKRRRKGNLSSTAKIENQTEQITMHTQLLLFRKHTEMNIYIFIFVFTRA